jgi:gliding motility-associated-like protein
MSVNKLNTPKYMIHYILTALFSFIICVFFSQVSGRFGNTSTNEFAYANCADMNGNSYLGGLQGSSGLVTKVNSANQVIWSKSIKLTSNNSYQTTISFVDQIGDTIFGCGFITSGNTIIGAGYFKLNATTGSQYWIQGNTSTPHYYSIMRYSMGTYYLVGAHNGASGNWNGKVTAVNSNSGTSIWQSNSLGIMFAPNIDYIDDFLGATEMINGQMFITGRSWIDGSGLDMRPLLIGISNTGNIFLNKYLILPENDGGTDRYYGMSIEYDGLNNLVIVFFGDQNYVGTSNYHVGIVKSDLNGNIIFCKEYDLGNCSNEIVKSVNVTNDHYVLFGYVNHGTTNTKLFSLKVEKDGSFVNAKLYSSATYKFNTLFGPINLGGNSDYKNNYHYFSASSYTNNINVRDMFQLVLDDSLNNTSGCLVEEIIPVSIYDFMPFSADVILVPQISNIPSSQQIDPVNYSISNCSGTSISFVQTENCDTTFVTATINGTSNYSVNWSNGETNLTTYVTNSEMLTLFVENETSCCIYSDSAYLNVVSNLSSITLPNDTMVCMSQFENFILSPTVTGSDPSIEYLWNNGTTNSTLPIQNSGTYSVTISNGCISLSDTINIIVNHFIESVYMTDIQVCENDLPLNINPTISGFDFINWNNGDQTQSTNIYSSGTYYYSASNECNVVNDTIIVNVTGSPSILSIPSIDTCLMMGDEINLFAEDYSQNFDFEWNTGSTSNLFEILNNGLYYLSISNECDSDTSFFNVNINYFIENTPLMDTAVCNGGFPITIAPTIVNFDSIEWNNGSTNSSILVNSAGIFSYSATNECNTVIDNIQITLLPEPSITSIQSIDTCLENGATIFLNSNDYTSEVFIQWSNGSNLNGLTITESNNYYLIASNSCGSDTSSFSVDINYPISYIVDPIYLCEKDLPFIYNLDIDNFDSIIWENQEITESVNIENFASYIFTAYNDCGNVTDSILIIQNADSLCISYTPSVIVPNVFSPNGDNINEFFELELMFIVDLELTILNRWGNIMYSGNGINAKWDGNNSNDEPANEGVYYYLYEAEGVNGETFKGHGFLHLTH